MDYTLLIVRVNYTLVAILALPLNTILLYLTVKKTSEELRSYSRTLQLICITDLIFTVIYVLGMPIMVTVSGSLNVISLNTGPLAAASSGSSSLSVIYLAVNRLSNQAWWFIRVFSQDLIAWQFVYRYAVLRRNGTGSGTIKDFSTVRFALFFIPALLHACLIGASNFYMLTTTTDAEWVDVWSNVMAEYPSLIDNCTLPVLAANNRLPASQMGSSLGVAVLFIDVGVIALFTLLILRHLNVAFNLSTQARIKRLQIEVTIAQGLQAVVPLPIYIIPMVILLIAVIHPVPGVVYFDIYAVACVSWATVVNPLFAIVIIRPYRRVVLRRLGWKSTNVVPSKPIVHSNTPVAQGPPTIAL